MFIAACFIPPHCVVRGFDESLDSLTSKPIKPGTHRSTLRHDFDLATSCQYAPRATVRVARALEVTLSRNISPSQDTVDLVGFARANFCQKHIFNIVTQRFDYDYDYDYDYGHEHERNARGVIFFTANLMSSI